MTILISAAEPNAEIVAFRFFANFQSCTRRVKIYHKLATRDSIGVEILNFINCDMEY